MAKIVITTMSSIKLKAALTHNPSPFAGEGKKVLLHFN
jgi:hypothetical protein